jgi:GTP 3',8-cyclase
MSILDRLARPLGNLRLSVTDRCNLRCEYCMPEDDYVWLPREDLLHFEEISVLVDIFGALGVDRVRLTGGEPLLRRDLAALVRILAAKPFLGDLALTTNGVLLADQAPALHAAGLRRITISLDTVRPDRFRALTRTDELPRVLEGIAAASRLWTPLVEVASPSSPPVSGPVDAPRRIDSPRGVDAPHPLKIDTVVIRGVNEEELSDLIEFGRTMNAEVRFIEYMDVGGATRWSPARVYTRHEMLGSLTRRYGRIEPLDCMGSSGSGEPFERSLSGAAPAQRFVLPNGTTFGIIASTTSPFCRSCDRSRLTADGMWYLCLYATSGIDLRGPLRQGAGPGQMEDQTEDQTKAQREARIEALISQAWRARSDRGAEARLELGDRRAFVPVGTLRRDPHLEMHTRGG